MSLTGRGGPVGLRGFGVLEKVAMACVMERPSDGFASVMQAKGDVPLHDVSILVLDMLTKQSSEVLCVFRVLQRKARLGR